MRASGKYGDGAQEEGDTRDGSLRDLGRALGDAARVLTCPRAEPQVLRRSVREAAAQILERTEAVDRVCSRQLGREPNARAWDQLVAHTP